VWREAKESSKTKVSVAAAFYSVINFVSTERFEPLVGLAFFNKKAQPTKSQLRLRYMLK
jgi:hypothetical protein